MPEYILCDKLQLKYMHLRTFFTEVLCTWQEMIEDIHKFINLQLTWLVTFALRLLVNIGRKIVILRVIFFCLVEKTAVRS